MSVFGFWLIVTLILSECAAPLVSMNFDIYASHTIFVFSLLQVKWCRENYHHSLGSPYSLRLASADAAGRIIVWDVVSGTPHCEIQEHSKPIQGEILGPLSLDNIHAIKKQTHLTIFLSPCFFHDVGN